MNVIATDKAPKISPFLISQAMVALKIGSTDETLLNYVDFLSEKIPTVGVSFLHVLPKNNPLLSSQELDAAAIIGKIGVKEEVLKRMENRVNNFFSSRKNLSIQYLVKEGNPLEELLFRAKTTNADLVIIGQDTSSVHHNILARNFVRKINNNALIVPDKSLPKLDKILVPIDFSTPSIEAFRIAVSINKSLDNPAEIICVNVYELPNLNFYNVEKTKYELKKIIEKDRKMAFYDFLMFNVSDNQEREFIKTAVIYKEDYDIGYYLNEFAKKEGIDLTIMGAKGHSRDDLILMGSVAERVLILSQQIPTFIVR